MKKLTSIKSLDVQQMQFVTTFLELGGRPADGMAAALQAGYTTEEKEAQRAASILLGSPAVVSAIKNEIARRFSAVAGAALKTILDLCESGPPSVRLAAAKEVLDRGIGPVASRSAVLYASTSFEDLLDAIDAEETADTPALSTDGLESS